MNPELINEMVDSHDELMKVCRVCIAILLEEKKIEKIDAYLFAEAVSPGFAERAEDVRRKIMRERITSLDPNSWN